jgi:hypothetical protein
VALDTGPIATENQFPCRTLVACLDACVPMLRAQDTVVPRVRAAHVPGGVSKDLRYFGDTHSAECSARLRMHRPLLEWFCHDTSLPTAGVPFIWGGLGSVAVPAAPSCIDDHRVWASDLPLGNTSSCGVPAEGLASLLDSCPRP